jgi:hypothetical protein
MISEGLSLPKVVVTQQLTHSNIISKNVALIISFFLKPVDWSVQRNQPIIFKESQMIFVF